MAALEDVEASQLDEFVELLLSMSYDDPTVRPLLDSRGSSSGVRDASRGYQQLESAVDSAALLWRRRRDTREPLPAMKDDLPSVDLRTLGFDGGGHVLVNLALAKLAPRQSVAVYEAS